VSLSMLRDDVAAFTQLFGPSGHEDSVITEFVKRVEMQGLHAVVDRLGNVVVRVRPAEAAWPTVAVTAHLDEVGFIVSEVGSGWARVNRVGGIHDKVIAGQRLQFRNDRGDLVDGHVGVNSAHLTTADEKWTVTKVEDVYVDLMMASADEITDVGLSPGAPGVFLGPFCQRDNLVRGKALDDRAGLAVLLALLRDMPELPAGPGLTVIATVQEEFTIRGGVAAAAAVRPDVLICVDIAPTAGVADEASGPRLGDGPALRHYSRGRSGAGLIPNPRLTAFIRQAAAARGIRLSHHTLDGGLTDASYMQYAGGGIAAVDLTFPVRNAHTAVEVADLQDLGLLVKLLCGFLAALRPGSDFARG
jgi:putative aminopeptidase